MKPEEVRDKINERLAGKTHAQIEAYVDNQIKDLASAKEHLKELTHIIFFMLNNPNWRIGE